MSSIKLFLGSSILVHDPVRALSLGSTTSVENQGLLHADQCGIRARLTGFDGAVLAGRFPVAGVSGPVGTMPIWVLPITRTEKEPLRIVRLYHRTPFVSQINQFTFFDR